MTFRQAFNIVMGKQPYTNYSFSEGIILSIVQGMAGGFILGIITSIVMISIFIIKNLI